MKSDEVRKFRDTLSSSGNRGCDCGICRLCTILVKIEAKCTEEEKAVIDHMYMSVEAAEMDRDFLVGKIEAIFGKRNLSEEETQKFKKVIRPPDMHKIRDSPCDCCDRWDYAQRHIDGGGDRVICTNEWHTLSLSEEDRYQKEEI